MYKTGSIECIGEYDILFFAYYLAEKNNIAHPFFVIKKKMNVECYNVIKMLLLQWVPESTSSAQARVLNKPMVDFLGRQVRLVYEKF